MSVLIGVVIGLVLGLTGAGGSIFAVPLLMLLLDLPINDTIGIALGAVAVSALIGTLSNWRANYILWVPAIALGLGGALVAPIGKYIGSQLPPSSLLIGFCVLAFIIAGLMWRQTVTAPERANVVRSGHGEENDLIQPICRFSPDDQFDTSPKCIAALTGCGLLVGLLSGLFGVGGGFLIVPALLFITQVSMRQAVATSLLIICVIGGTGFASFVVGNSTVDWLLLAKVCVGGLLGMLVGRLIADRIAGPQLQKVFALALITIAALTLTNKLINGVI
ncbi:sulfite exporter TauE/SafE family protein [Porticoccaceae bacterium]|nr:sulfite exporter TauE/SafE family protein [Porticoccaceae bacterium]MDC1476761.1 sulfite exporter TauE/SafE family protein [Porticoccaceae bacterium]